MPECLLFLDVDGVLLSFGGEVRRHAPAPPSDVNPLLARVDPALGPALTGLGCRLVWATAWGGGAGRPGRGHWKTRSLVAHAVGRAFVWVDDEIGDADRRWVAAHHAGPALLHAVDPARGLGAEDFAAIRRWLRGRWLQG